MRPLVSVIIPTFNRAELVVRAINSVIEQTYINLEIIVVDDGSTDNTIELLKQFSEITIIRQKNSGVSSARNNGIRCSSGEYIAFLDSDDQWLPDKIELQVNFLLSNSNYDWVHCNETWIRNGKELKQLSKHKKGGEDQFIPSLGLCLIGPSCVLLKRSLFDIYGQFNENYTVCEDYDLWLRLTSVLKIGFIEKSLTIKHGGHDDQLSIRFFAMDFWRVKSIHWVLANRELSECRTDIAIKTLVKKSRRLLKGYHKHNNTKDINEIETILNSYLHFVS